MEFIDFFSGIGGFTRGMELAGHKCVGHCEIDKFAEASYRSMHLITNEQRRYLLTMPLKKRQKEILKDEYLNGDWYADDVQSIRPDNLPRAECWCFGFPCQDISISGKQRGFTDGKRSSLFFAIMELVAQLEEKDRPEWLFIENVKNLLSINKGFDFARLLVEMDGRGYDVEWRLLDSQYFGVPQHRERVFIIGHLRGRGGRKVFPAADNNKQVAVIQGQQSGTITTRTGEATSTGIYIADKRLPQKVKQVGNCMRTKMRDNPNQGRIYDTCGIVPTLTDMGGSGRESHIIVKTNTRKGFETAAPGDSINIQQPNSQTRRGRVGKGKSNTLQTGQDQAVITDDLRIRKLTPKECFRLQGWADDYFEKAKQFNSDSQLYKQAGNGVTVNVIKAIAERITK